MKHINIILAGLLFSAVLLVTGAFGTAFFSYASASGNIPSQESVTNQYASREDIGFIEAILKKITSPKIAIAFLVILAILLIDVLYILIGIIVIAIMSK